MTGKCQPSGPPLQWETRQALFPTDLDPLVGIFLSPLNINNGFYLSSIAPVKAFFNQKNVDIFPISPQKHMLWVLIRGASMSTHNMFLWRNTKNIFLLPPLIWSYIQINIFLVLQKNVIGFSFKSLPLRNASVK